jgi:hypothetical protein
MIGPNPHRTHAESGCRAQVTCQTETWEAVIALKKQGKIRAIGVSNCTPSPPSHIPPIGVFRPDPARGVRDAHHAWLALLR